MVTESALSVVRAGGAPRSPGSRGCPSLGACGRAGAGARARSGAAVAPRTAEPVDPHRYGRDMAGAPDGRAAPALTLHPGFPLRRSDYAELEALLAGGIDGHAHVVVAHSRGALDALQAGPASCYPLFLLAPSSPGRRPLAPAVRASLRMVGRVPLLRDAGARALRDLSSRRYGTRAPGGLPLDLLTAAERLGPVPRTGAQPAGRRIIVVVSPDDPRRDAQLALACRLGATVLHAPGGHLFPLTHPRETASLLSTAL
jgi:hypothetical protein